MSTKHLIKGKVLFPHLTLPDDYGNFSVTMLVPKDSTLGNGTLKHAQEVYKGDTKLSWLDDSLTSLSDGDESAYPSHKGNWVIRLKSKKPVPCLDSDNTPLKLGHAADKIERGSTVGAQISYWYQDNKYGQALRANVHAVKFIEAPKGDDVAAVKALSGFDFGSDDEELPF